MGTSDATRGARSLSPDSLPRMFVFFCLLIFAAAVECWRLSALRDPEIWGHLRAGTWILQNKAWPHSGLFSQSPKLPWRDFSWGFDVLAAIAFRIAGYAALPALLIVLRVALALLTFLLAGGWRNFWLAAVVSAIAQCVLLAMGPGPAFLSALLFAYEARVLWEVRESGDGRRLVALPFLFVLWANMDTGFAYGIALYVIFLLALLVESRFPLGNLAVLDRAAAGLALLRSAWIGAACIAASFLSPYGVQAYVSFFANEVSPVNSNLASYHALGFRQPQDYVLMLLGMAAYLALGLVRSRDIFQIAALAGCTAFAFHSQRESWLLALIAVAVIGQAIRKARFAKASLARPQRTPWRLAVLAAATVLPLCVFFAGKGRNQDLLFAKVAENFPVGAADFLRRHPQPAPLFNDYKWGAFLTWYLPEVPVAIDARRGLYPEETEVGYFKAMNSDIPYREYPPMNQARTLLMDKSSIMGQALRGVAGFQVIYEDNLAIVYSHESKEQP